ncbi:hypothetical protein [Caballeronia sp. Lep1P3]|uniref:hypothetical protein n=1 Tax=Caballeronia sp. Lep1P3 TaxID=2878150 RepID=UPI001FD078E6|nr:hypothetical protein [Caballeronia sp. Lep1P3]
MEKIDRNMLNACSIAGGTAKTSSSSSNSTTVTIGISAPAQSPNNNQKAVLLSVSTR